MPPLLTCRRQGSNHQPSEPPVTGEDYARGSKCFVMINNVGGKVSQFGHDVRFSLNLISTHPHVRLHQRFLKNPKHHIKVLKVLRPFQVNNDVSTNSMTEKSKKENLKVCLSEVSNQRLSLSVPPSLCDGLSQQVSVFRV